VERAKHLNRVRVSEAIDDTRAGGREVKALGLGPNPEKVAGSNPPRRQSSKKSGEYKNRTRDLYYAKEARCRLPTTNAQDGQL
jgi:hypothetical protein